MLALKRPLPRKRQLVITLGVTAVLMAGYIALLNHEEHVMEEYYHDLRRSDPDLYLSKIMQAHGFRRFIDEYQKIHDYTQPKKDVPPFLLGRWALFENSKHVSDSYIPDACLNGVEIEDGRIKFFGEKSDDITVRYTLTGNTVTAHPTNGAELEIGVIGYGSHIHHIELKTPGSKKPEYGYMCR